YCDRVVVMEKGKVVETAPSAAIFTAPAHPYTRKLMRATPRPNISLRDLLPADDPAHSPPPSGEGLGVGVAGLPHGYATRSTPLPNPSLPLGGKPPLLLVEKLIKEYPRKGITGSLH